MSEAPNYGFHRNPRFSVNHVADYISATTAGQREGVIRSAKFPRKAAVIPYSISKRIICQFLAGNSGDLSSLDEDVRRLETRLRREPDGWMQMELRRNLDCLEEFKKAFRKAKKFQFINGPTDMTMSLEGVRINARLDLTLTETDKSGVTLSGGCTMFIANTKASRKNIEDRRKTVAALIHWGLQNSNPNFEPVPRLCLSFDVFGATITPAPTAIDRLRANVRTSCREAADSWDRVTPPAGYDGPDWR